MRKINNPHFKRSLTQLTEELVASTPTSHNWKGILIALFVIGQVIGLVALAVYIITPRDNLLHLSGRRIEKQDLYDAAFRPNKFNSTWISGDEFVYVTEDEDVHFYNAVNCSNQPIISKFVYRQISPDKILVSPDKNYILLRQSERRAWEGVVLDILGSEGEGTCPNQRDWSSGSLSLDLTPCWNYSIYNTTSKWHSDFLSGLQLEAFKWSTVGSSFAAVQNHDLYYWQSPSDPPTRLTHTGEVGKVYNGVTDWLYRERVHCTPQSFWFSPDGRFLAFLAINNTQVEKLKSLRLGLYNIKHMIPYSRTGKPLPSVQLHLVDLHLNRQPRRLNLPASLHSVAGYLSEARWSSSQSFTVTWVPRNQRSQGFLVCHVYSRNCTLVHSVAGYSDQLLPAYISQDRTRLLYKGIIGGRVELIMKDISSSGGPETSLTPGSHPVKSIKSIEGWDEQAGKIFFIGFGLGGVENLYVVEVEQTDRPDRILCLSCSNTVFQSVFHISPSYKFVLEERRVLKESVLIPETLLMSIETGSTVEVLDLNSRMNTNLETLALPRRRLIEFEGESKKIDLELLVPPSVLQSSDLTFPLLLVMPDESPGSGAEQRAGLGWSQRAGLGWSHYLAGHTGFIVGRVHLREKKEVVGATGPASSRALQFSEIRDILQFVRFLMTNISYVSSPDICILGRSYGAWLTASVLSEDTESLLKCAVLVNPISSWDNLDTWRSETHLGEIEHNFVQYDSSDISHYATSFAKRREISLLLIDESTEQPNQIQQTFALSKLLVEKGVVFKQMIYPDENYPGENVPHLISIIENFVESEFAELELKLAPSLARSKVDKQPRRPPAQ